MKNIEEEIRLLLKTYLDTYFLNRDFIGTMKMIGPGVSGFGTGLDERAYNYNDFEVLFTRDFEQAPERVNYEIIDSIINGFGDHTGIAWCELNIRTHIMDQEVKINNLRLSLVFIKSQDKWLIEHMHISLPTDAHEGDETYPIKELEDRNKVLERMVEEKTRSLHEAVKEISRIAVTDKLTGLFNRNRIDEAINQEIHRAKRYKKNFSIILMDIDYFKEVNDSCGHLTGDKVLAQFSRLLNDHTRETDILGRWGGEEFIIICPETDLDEALLLAEKLRHAVESYQFLEINKRTASFGVVDYQVCDTYDSLISRVDAALYQSKNHGRNCVYCG
ncbi:diguanylate cyclase [Eubacteriaceae bacterium ES3]|nr:diguanylate cyclase [Eubacteriaceae bacterium ES3]